MYISYTNNIFKFVCSVIICYCVIINAKYGNEMFKHIKKSTKMKVLLHFRTRKGSKNQNMIINQKNILIYFSKTCSLKPYTVSRFSENFFF